MVPFQIVIDTNVLVSALHSKKGASYKLITLVGQGYFDIHLSVPLILEYEDAVKRSPTLPIDAIDDILDYLCAVSHHHDIFFLWRPFLRDPHDDMVLELAVSANSDYIVTHNTKDFRGIAQFGIDTMTPGEFLRKIGGI